MLKFEAQKSVSLIRNHKGGYRLLNTRKFAKKITERSSRSAATNDRFGYFQLGFELTITKQTQLDSTTLNYDDNGSGFIFSVPEPWFHRYPQVI